MLAVIDESGHPHPNDPTTRPVLVAVNLGSSELRRMDISGGCGRCEAWGWFWFAVPSDA